MFYGFISALVCRTALFLSLSLSDQLLQLQTSFYCRPSPWCSPPTSLFSHTLTPTSTALVQQPHPLQSTSLMNSHLSLHQQLPVQGPEDRSCRRFSRGATVSRSSSSANHERWRHWPQWSQPRRRERLLPEQQKGTQKNGSDAFSVRASKNHRRQRWCSYSHFNVFSSLSNHKGQLHLPVHFLLVRGERAEIRKEQKYCWTNDDIFSLFLFLHEQKVHSTNVHSLSFTPESTSLRMGVLWVKMYSFNQSVFLFLPSITLPSIIKIKL